MAYLFTLGAYSINRASDFEEDLVSHPERTSHLESRRKVLPVIAGSSFFIGYELALARNILFFAGLLVPLLLAVAYSITSKKMEKLVGIARLKDGLLVKNVAISFGWSLIPLLVGLYFQQLPVALFLLSPFIFLRLMVNTVFFDERDLEADRQYGVRTIPVSLGVAKAELLMNVVDVTSCVYLIALVLLNAIPVFMVGLAVFTPYSVGYRLYSRRNVKHRDSLRDLAADGEYVLWGVVTSLGHL
jgi:4-hydroxybenzoate polyprenyltransferase